MCINLQINLQISLEWTLKTGGFKWRFKVAHACTSWNLSAMWSERFLFAFIVSLLKRMNHALVLFHETEWPICSRQVPGSIPFCGTSRHLFFIYFSVFLLLICGMWLLVVICVLFCRQTCMIQNRTRSDEDMKVSIPMIVSACGWVSQLVKHRDTFCLWFKQEMTGSIDSSLIFFIVNSGGGGGGAQQSALKHEILQTIVWTWTILSL